MHCRGPLPPKRTKQAKWCSPYCRYASFGLKKKLKRRAQKAVRTRKINQETHTIRRIAIHLALKPPHDIEDVLTVLRTVYAAGFKDAADAAKLVQTLDELLTQDPGIADLLATKIGV
jgi:hypothetical protein